MSNASEAAVRPAPKAPTAAAAAANPRAKTARPVWERFSGLALAAMALVTAAAVYGGVRFGLAALDGESRRGSTLAGILRPDYVGTNRVAPDFTLNDRNGRPLRLSSLRGRTVVLHFWSRECPPCIREIGESIPTFDEIVQTRSDLALVLVTVDPDWNSVAALVPPSIRAPLLFDPTRAVVQGKYGTRLFPETWIIDPNGVIRARFDHTLDWTRPALVEYIDSLR